MGSTVATRIPAEIVIANSEMLRRHDPVLVQFRTGEQQVGIVDEVFTEGKVLWIWTTGPKVRQLILMADVNYIKVRTADFSTARLAVLLQRTA
ncbi:hypothetical protein QFZ79_001277 [Arthrobacter sp. V4I6]|uniref:hypothetical protein n=1 Tax=unclassified Arthrobacter TaxID=235627 RepID=UPI00278120C1|nr:MULTISPECIES: hypothetical protein [unclassified Arthrobacter]MDQ0823530.1 hypothetical protein [Arthrobacter sp. V1I7]MDQ0853166.1 hypothetical protein [Arthrobacter sp. V4I6]